MGNKALIEDWDIRTIILAGSRMSRITMEGIDGVAPIGHFVEAIDRIVMLTFLLLARGIETNIIGIIMMGNQVILTIMGIAQRANRY